MLALPAAMTAQRLEVQTALGVPMQAQRVVVVPAAQLAVAAVARAAIRPRSPGVAAHLYFWGLPARSQFCSSCCS
jgi:hypothetical protein